MKTESGIQVVDTALAATGLEPDAAFAAGTKLDLSKAFYPFGPTPQPGSVFYLSSNETFAKPGAFVRLAIHRLADPIDDTIDAQLTPKVRWEYWDGKGWTGLTMAQHQGQPVAEDNPNFRHDGVFGFTVPEQGIPESTINDTKGRWIRARLLSGAYARRKTVTLPQPPSPAVTTDVTVVALTTAVAAGPPTITIVENVPPL